MGELRYGPGKRVAKTLEEFLANAKPGEFKPSMHYSKDGQFWEIYLANEPCYHTTIHPQVDVGISEETGKVVAVTVWDHPKRSKRDDGSTIREGGDGAD